MFINTNDTEMKKLPEKKPGRHRFIGVATFSLTRESIESAHTEGGDPAIMGAENLWDVSYGCIDCEQPYTKDMKKFCAAPAYEG